MITINRFIARIKRFVLRNLPVAAGKEFEKNIREALSEICKRYEGFWFHKYYLNRMFEGKFPYIIGDYEAVYQGQFYVIECKTTKNLRYPIKYVKEHQIETALQLEKAGAIY